MSCHIEPNKSIKLESSFYVGPKTQPVLQEIAPGLDLTVDYMEFCSSYQRHFIYNPETSYLRNREKLGLGNHNHLQF